MKKLLIPVLIAVLAGVGGGSGFAYMQASKAYVVDSTHVADSVKAHPAAAGDTEKAASHAVADTPVLKPVEEEVPMTPADSIRALEASRAAARTVAKGAPVAGTPGHSAPTTATAPTVPDAKHAAVAPAVVPTASPAHAETPKGTSATASVANIVREARNEAMSTALPEQRLSKIFAAMSAKDAAKVMEQMPDTDVRAILALMSDRNAAAVLSQFPAARAAAITKGIARQPEQKP